MKYYFFSIYNKQDLWDTIWYHPYKWHCYLGIHNKKFNNDKKRGPCPELCECRNSETYPMHSIRKSISIIIKKLNKQLAKQSTNK